MTEADTFDSIYSALRNQARRHLRREQNAHSMSPTVLVHEAWITLARSRHVNVNDRSHYVRLVSRVMKNLLIDHARRRKSTVNGGSLQRIELKDAPGACWDSSEILAVATALEGLAAQSPRLAELVELRYFAGFTEAEVGQILGMASRSVRRQWSVARLRLLDALKSGGHAGGHVDG